MTLVGDEERILVREFEKVAMGQLQALRHGYELGWKEFHSAFQPYPDWIAPHLLEAAGRLSPERIQGTGAPLVNEIAYHVGLALGNVIGFAELCLVKAYPPVLETYKRVILDAMRAIHAGVERLSPVRLVHFVTQIEKSWSKVPYKSPQERFVMDLAAIFEA